MAGYVIICLHRIRPGKPDKPVAVHVGRDRMFMSLRPVEVSIGPDRFEVRETRSEVEAIIKDSR
jgi:hypothetical protein